MRIGRQQADRFDVIVIGVGCGGDTAAGRLLAAGKRVAVVERELFGGGVLVLGVHPVQDAEARTEAVRAARGRGHLGTGLAGAAGLPRLHGRHLDDAAQARGYEEPGGHRDQGHRADHRPWPGRGGRELLEADHVVIATGSAPVRPDIDGLDQVPVWTNREATNVRDFPARVLLIGGSAAGQASRAPPGHFRLAGHRGSGRSPSYLIPGLTEWAVRHTAGP